MSSSGTRSPLVEKDDEILENVGDDVVVRPIGEQEEPLERNLTEENESDDEETASAVNPLASNAAAQVLPVLQNLLLSNDSQRERLTGLIQLYVPTAQDTSAMVNEESEQSAREAELSSQVHFLEQSVQKLEEELENLKKLNAQLEEQIKRLTKSSDP